MQKIGLVTAAVLAIGLLVQTRLSCAQSPQDLRAAVERAIQADPMGQKEMPTPGAKDRTTWIGAVIEESCFRGVDEARAQSRLERIEAALMTAIAQLDRCGQSLGFIETTDVISVLRRLRVFCNATDGMAAMVMLYPHGKKGRISARSLHRYEMLLAVPSFKDGAEQQARQPSFERWPLEDLAAVLAHEAMHVLPLNNRDWHNGLEGRAKFGCERSTYEDRVYLTEGACFPNSRGGVVLYADNGPWKCPEVCVEALTGMDSLTALKLRPLPPNAPEGTPGVYGEPLLAGPYPLEQAQAICAKVRTLRGQF